MENKKIYAIDFDGVLCTNNYPEIGEPNICMIEYAKKLKQNNHILILWTCREGEDLNKAIEWCKKFNLTFDYVNDNAKQSIQKYNNNCRKINADYYIDDRATLPLSY